MINDFTRKFTEEKIDYILIDKRFYLVNEDLSLLLPKIDINCESVGVFLGKMVKTHFVPSLPLIQWIGERTKSLAQIDEKSSWLFICGRDVFNDSILSCSVGKGHVIVQNDKNEVLGYGFKDSKGIANNRHIGEYLTVESL